MDFIKKNWKMLLVYGALIISIITCVIVLCVKCVNDNKPNGTTVIKGDELEEMISHKEDFVVVIGQYDCSACQMFNETLREYTKDGKKVYYFYADNENDINAPKTITLIKSKLKEIPKERGISILLTPTTIFVEDGIFKDAYQGHVSLSDNEKYEEFKKIVEGQYVKRKTIITSDEYYEMINNHEDFVFTIGIPGCSNCANFETTINRYVQEGNSLYYMYIYYEENHPSISLISEIFEYLEVYIPSDRNVSDIAPITLCIRDGVIVDIYQGTLDTYNESDYALFKAILNGDYVGEAYPL